MEKRLSEVEGMPVSTLRDWGEVVPNFILQEQLDYNHDILAAKVQYGLERLNEEQRAVYNDLMIKIWATLFFFTVPVVVERLLSVTP